jgi:hypothetical protein
VNITVDAVKERIRRRDFLDVRIDRLAHRTGFVREPDPGSLNTDALRRSIGPGSNEELIHTENLGVDGPILIEVGYGSQTIRVRMYRGYALLRVWDLYTWWKPERLDQWETSFNNSLDALLDEDAKTRKTWVRDHAS